MNRSDHTREELAAWVQILLAALMFVLLCALATGCSTVEVIAQEATALPPEAWAILLVIATYFFAPRA